MVRACAHKCRATRQLYIENDEKAYQVDRELEKQRRFHYQKDFAKEEAKVFKITRKSKEGNPIVKIKLSAPNNKHPFLAEQVATQVVSTLKDVEIEINCEEVFVTSPAHMAHAHTAPPCCTQPRHQAAL